MTFDVVYTKNNNPDIIFLSENFKSLLNFYSRVLFNKYVFTIFIILIISIQKKKYKYHCAKSQILHFFNNLYALFV